MTDTQKIAVEKINQACKTYKGGRHGSVVARPVADTLMRFCEENEDFAAVIAETDKTFSDCIVEVVRGVGNAIADIEAYRRAVKFYFPEAEIIVDMRIILSGGGVEKPVETVDNSQEETKAPADQSENKIISLFDIL
ncbi:MAG: hypothetical protein IIY61_00170 [Ruminococcus sp.]|nr:hypothetical protein [Ruminococcus sp.]